jgi:hypothetical protein
VLGRDSRVMPSRVGAIFRWHRPEDAPSPSPLSMKGFPKPGDEQLRICLYLLAFASPKFPSDGKFLQQNAQKIFTVRFTVKNVCLNRALNVQVDSQKALPTSKLAIQ